MTPYVTPQESGNRTGVRWADLFDADGNRLRIEALDTPFELGVSPYTPFQIESAQRPIDLPKPNGRSSRFLPAKWVWRAMTVGVRWHILLISLKQENHLR